MSDPAADIPEGFWADLVSVSQRLQCDPLDLLRPLMNESGLRASAHNPRGDAAGLFQAMPATLRRLGFAGDWKDFVALDADEQLTWLEAYYKPYTGRLTNSTACYLATFAPAFLAHADEPDFVICARDGGGAVSHLGGSSVSVRWYLQNAGLDANRDGAISVGDLTATIARADVGPRWDAAVAHVQAVLASLHRGPDTMPEPIGGVVDLVTDPADSIPPPDAA